AVLAQFGVPRQVQRRHDLSNDALFSEDALVSEEPESLSSRVEHHPPSWRFFILHLSRYGAVLLERFPHGNVIARVNPEVVVFFSFAQESTVNEQLSVNDPENPHSRFWL